MGETLAQAREAGEDGVLPAGDLGVVADEVGAEQKVLGDGQLGEACRPSGTCRSPAAAMRWAVQR